MVTNLLAAEKLEECDRPPSIENATFTTGNGYAIGETAKYECKGPPQEGQRANSFTLTCVQRGRKLVWRGEIVSCDYCEKCTGKH